MQRGSTGHMLFVIAAGLVSLAVCAVIGVALIRLSHYALGGSVTAILIAALFIVWLRQWWKRGEENYQDRAAENEVEYLEELADEHKRGVKDHNERLRYLLKHSKIKNPERYKSRIDNVRRVIGDR
jgi:hypothetical protein